LAIPATLPLILFGFALGLLLSPFATLYHDLLKGISIVLTSWMFVTPVLYPLPPGEGLLQSIVRWNPVTPLLMTPRELATGMPLTLPVGFAVVGFVAAAALAVAWLVYKVSLPYVIERLRA
jgi:lipopolysaccharide transport system permease protein